MKNVAIVDYGMCNLDSVYRAVEECGAEAVVTSEKGVLAKADCIILPGVGSFADGMKHIRELGLEEPLKEEVVSKGIPLLGICLGMQLLADSGCEGGETKGLGLIPGRIERLRPVSNDTKIPHIGWNEVFIEKGSGLFNGISSGRDFYFVHSYSFNCADKSDILAQTPYCGSFVSAVEKNNIYGVQFHPEKSMRWGLELVRNFLSL